MASKSEPSTRKMIVKGNAAAFYNPALEGDKEEALEFLERCNAERETDA